MATKSAGKGPKEGLKANCAKCDFKCGKKGPKQKNKKIGLFY